jgi:hypothetical protein
MRQHRNSPTRTRRMGRAQRNPSRLHPRGSMMGFARALPILRHHRHAFAFSRLNSPELCLILHPLEPRGRREGRVPAAPAVRCAKSTRRKPHSSIQVKPNTRPSLRSGWTAYAVLSREPSSFWPPSPSRNSPTPRRLTRVPPPQRLDRSNDGQDHTVLPYARSLAPQGFPALSTLREKCWRDELTAPLIRHEASGSRRTIRPAHASHARRCRVHRNPALDSDDTRSPLLVSRDGRHIRQIRISVKRNIFAQAD